jgi:hypothetical protein
MLLTGQRQVTIDASNRGWLLLISGPSSAAPSWSRYANSGCSPDPRLSRVYSIRPRFTRQRGQLARKRRRTSRSSLGGIFEEIDDLPIQRTEISRQRNPETVMHAGLRRIREARDSICWYLTTLQSRKWRSLLFHGRIDLTDARGWSWIVIRSLEELSDPIRDDRLRSRLPTRVNFPAAGRDCAYKTAASASRCGLAMPRAT